MRRLLFTLIVLVLSAPLTPGALERPDREFKVFQFPRDRMPRIDGDTLDWDIVPESYAVGMDELVDTESGHGADRNPDDLDVTVRVGWVKGLDRLYVLYEAYDDFWNMYYKRGDIFEVAVDADLSGGPYGVNPQMPDRWDNYFGFKGIHAQNYHILTPPGEGRDWMLVPGCNPWIGDFPWANGVFSYDFKEGEGGKLVLECWITPFNYAPYDGPDRAVVSRLAEDALIGLSWAVLDYDEVQGQLDGFWNLSHTSAMASDASALCAFRLMSPEPPFIKPIEADWDFTVLDMDARTVIFTDRSSGEIVSRSWDFDDGSSSTDECPVHRYEKPGEYTVTLTVSGPAGTSKLTRVRRVVVR